MNFPKTNKIHKTNRERFGENAKLVEEALAKLNLRLFFRWYVIFFSIFLGSLFLVIVAIRAALSLF